MNYDKLMKYIRTYLLNVKISDLRLNMVNIILYLPITCEL